MISSAIPELIQLNHILISSWFGLVVLEQQLLKVENNGEPLLCANLPHPLYLRSDPPFLCFFGMISE